MSEKNGNTKSIPEASIDMRLVFDRLKTSKPDEVISYEDLSSIIGTDTRRGRGYSVVSSARRKALNQLGMVFEAISGTGIKRLSDRQISRVGDGVIRSIRRRAKIGTKKLACVGDFSALPNEDKIAHNASLSMLGAVAQAMTTKTLDRIEAAVKEASKELPVAKTLALFGGK